jgi:hypothetical protein
MIRSAGLVFAIALAGCAPTGGETAAGSESLSNGHIQVVNKAVSRYILSGPIDWGNLPTGVVNFDLSATDSGSGQNPVYTGHLSLTDSAGHGVIDQDVQLTEQVHQPRAPGEIFDILSGDVTYNGQSVQLTVQIKSGPQGYVELVLSAPPTGTKEFDMSTPAADGSGITISE